MTDPGSRCRRLIFGVEKSMRYHRRHAQFMRTLSRLMTFVSALAGTAVVASMLGEKNALASAMGIAVAILGTIQLVFDIDGKVRENEGALKDFTRLRKSINDCPSFDESLVIEWENVRREIESGFVAELDALNVSCHNQLCEARSEPDQIRYIRPFQKVFLHLLSWQSDFPLLSDYRAAREARRNRKTATT